MPFRSKPYRNGTLALGVAVALALLPACSAHRKASVTVTAPSAPTLPVETPAVDYNRLPAPALALLEEARSWLGTKYVYGGNTRSGVDCSGFVLQVFDKALGIKLPRSSADQSAYCSPVKKSELVVGDLIFFVTGGPGKISHVGMYIGGDNMIHASSTRGVTVSSLSSDYYVSHFHSYGRVAPYYKMISAKPDKNSDAAERKISDAEQLRLDLERVLDQKTDSIISEIPD